MTLRRLVASLLFLFLGLGCQEGTSNASPNADDASAPAEVAADAPAAKAPAAASPTDPASTDDNLYLLGTLLGRQLVELQLDPREVGILEKGLRDAALGKPLDVEDNDPRARLSAFREQRVARFTQNFLAEQAKAPGAQVFPSGLIMTHTEEGSGDAPNPAQIVKVHYRGTLADGDVFDSSYQRGAPTEFPLNGVIPCWTEGVGKMKVGGKARLVCPPELAYGKNGAPPKIPPGSALVFDVELIDLVR